MLLPLNGSGSVRHDDSAGAGGKYVPAHADGVEDLEAATEGEGLPRQQGVVPINE